jgi:hypothetical protein
MVCGRHDETDFIEQVNVAVTVENFIREVLCSNLGTYFSCPDLRFSRLSSILPGKHWDCTSVMSWLFLSKYFIIHYSAIMVPLDVASIHMLRCRTSLNKQQNISDRFFFSKLHILQERELCCHLRGWAQMPIRTFGRLGRLWTHFWDPTPRIFPHNVSPLSTPNMQLPLTDWTCKPLLHTVCHRKFSPSNKQISQQCPTRYLEAPISVWHDQMVWTSQKNREIIDS